MRWSVIALSLFVVFALPNAVFAQSAQRETVGVSAISDKKVKSAVFNILRHYKAGGAFSAIRVLRECYGNLGDTAPYNEVERCISMDISLCSIFKILAEGNGWPLEEYCDQDRVTRRVGYWVDEVVAVKNDRLIFMGMIAGFAKEGIEEYTAAMEKRR